MKCPYCQNDLMGDTDVCPFCRHQILYCSACGSLVFSTDSHCKVCGMDMSSSVMPACKQCGKVLERGETLSMLCRECRSVLNSSGGGKSPVPISPVPPEASGGKGKILATTGVLLCLILGFVLWKTLPVFQEQVLRTETTAAESAESGASKAGAEKTEEQEEVLWYSDSYADNHSYYGNSFQNVSEGGLLVADADWVYYVSTNDDFHIWRMRQDGSEKSVVVERPCGHMNYRNGWLYYREWNTGLLYRRNLESGQEELLVDYNTYEPKIVGRYIYYGYQVKRQGESRASFDLYRCELDGSDQTKLTDGVVLYCCVADKRIYYFDTNDEVYKKGFSVNLDGEDKQLWDANQVSCIDYVDHLIYFAEAEQAGLFTLNPETEEIRKISNEAVSYINIYKGWCYYGDRNDNGKLYRMNLEDPTQIEFLSDDPVELLNVCADIICYHIRGEEETTGFRMLRVDGSSV